MTHRWEAEQTVEPDLALTLIRTQFPELDAEKIQLFGVGWDNTAYLIDDTYVFRFPRRQIVVPLLEAERLILPDIVDHLPLPIPNPQWAGEATEEFGWPFLGYRLLHGKTACRAGLFNSERMEAAVPLAQFLKALHAMPISASMRATLIGYTLEKLNGPKLIAEIVSNLAEIVFVGLVESSQPFYELIECLQNVRPEKKSILVHGDLYARHILVNEAHQICGVIDWGDVHIGDAAVDLSIAHSFLPIKAHDLFRKAYGEISEETWQLARLRALYSSTILVIFGYHSGDDIIKTEGIRALHCLVAT